MNIKAITLLDCEEPSGQVRLSPLSLLPQHGALFVDLFSGASCDPSSERPLGLDMLKAHADLCSNCMPYPL